MCSRDEKETAGSWAVSLFPFHAQAGGQRQDREDEEMMERKRMMESKGAGLRRRGRCEDKDFLE